jgi:hypothetical protein
MEEEEQGDYTARASLAMVGHYFRMMEIWPIVCQHVHIPQKVKQHQPQEKLLDCFLNILAGGHGLIELHTLIRPDLVVQRAFGRSSCAEQSTISDTLDACDAQTNAHMRAALKDILARHGQASRHSYTQQLHVWDVDMTGWPGGRQGEGVEKAFFADHAHRRGRQLGRVLATPYDEVLVDRLYNGKRQLENCLCELVRDAEVMLETDADDEAARNRRKNTVLRVDGGGGTEADINWMLSRQYHVMVKLRNALRAHKLAQSVVAWVVDERFPARQLGWVEHPTRYGAPTRQLAIRTRKLGGPKAGEWGHCVLVFTLSDTQLSDLLAAPSPTSPADPQALFNALHFYDLRGGAAETQFKGDKQGLGLAHRNKRRFYAQDMLVLLGQLAHNFVIWMRNRLARVDSRFASFGIHRIVRDVFRIDGCVRFRQEGGLEQLEQVVLNPRHPLSDVVARAFSPDYV